MIFSSTIFLFIFLPVLLLVYYISNNKLKNSCLFIASLIFYAWGDPRYLILLLISIIINYAAGIIIEEQTNKKIKILAFVITLLFNAGLLIYFKYLGFILNNINDVLKLNLTIIEIGLPIGISFYTFKSISYIVDVYCKKAKAQKNILSLGLYISFFPQLIAGPIERYVDIEEQINSDREKDLQQVYQGVKIFMIGFVKKVLIADQVAALANLSFSTHDLLGPLAWLGIIAYTIQIYFDFSGYSDMAIGIGRLFGFEFVKNFDYPYISTSIKDFWKRWHISLSTWFKDYVYIPLGGSKCSKMKSYFNLIFVFLLTGVWHGASWNFIIWGLYYVIFLILERVWLSDFLKSKNRIIGRIYTIIVIMFGWIFFRSDNLSLSIKYIKSLFYFPQNCWNEVFLKVNIEVLLILIIGIVFSFPLYNKIERKLKKGEIAIDFMILSLFLIAIMYMVGNGFSPFLYLRF